MPQFAPGVVKTAKAPVTVIPSGLNCQAELYLGNKAATSGLIPFTSTGAAQSVTFPITMPSTSGAYHVYLDIFVSGILIGAYIATEDVVIATLVAPALDILSLTWNSLNFLPGSTHSATLQVRNPTTANWTYLIKLLIGGVEKASWTQAIAAGQTVNLTATITMPATGGCYAVTVTVVETSTNTDLGIFVGESICIIATLDLQVAADSDDCVVFWCNNWLISLIGGQVAGRWDTTHYKYGGGMRFTNVFIPKGATIISAYLTFLSALTAGGVVNTVIIGQKTGNALTFSTLADYQARRGTIVGGANNNNITLASVSWNNIAGWAANVEYNSPELKTIIQEIVNQSDWANALVLFWDDHAGNSSYIRSAYGYYNSPTKAAKLHIEYTLP